MEKLQFILKENVPLLFDEKGRRVTTLGFKFEFEGKQYGSYMVINKPTVTAEEVMQTLKDLCPSIEDALKLAQETKSI